jgi:hypothetical protein
METNNEFDLKKLKQDYESKRILFSLPSYDEMAKEFEIEKVSEKDTEFLLREIRRVVIEKISAYIHLFETILSPSSGSLLIFSILKNLNEEDKKTIRSIYKKLTKTQISAIRLDTSYDEILEAEFINKMYKEWQELKKPIIELFEKFEKNFETDISPGNNGYFG